MQLQCTEQGDQNTFALMRTQPAAPQPAFPAAGVVLTPGAQR